MLKNPLQERLHKYKHEVAAIGSDIERLENEKKIEWNLIKDFGSVDSIRAASGEKRIGKLISEIKTLTNKRNKLQRFIDENGTSEQWDT